MSQVGVALFPSFYHFLSVLELCDLLRCSFITAIELLGNPAEMYVHGTQFWMSCVAFIIVIPITSYFYLPVYRKLNLTSAYEVSNNLWETEVRKTKDGIVASMGKRDDIWIVHYGKRKLYLWVEDI